MDVLNFEDCIHNRGKDQIEGEIVSGIYLAHEILSMKDHSEYVSCDLAQKIADPAYHLQNGDNADRTLYNSFCTLDDFELDIVRIRICECVHHTNRLGLLDHDPYSNNIDPELKILPLRMAGENAYAQLRLYLQPFFERISLPEPEIIPDQRIFRFLVEEYYLGQCLETESAVNEHIRDHVACDYASRRPKLCLALCNDENLRKRIVSSIAKFRHLT